jgi:arylformamidase
MDQATLDREYSPSSRVTDVGRFLSAYAIDSDHARARLAVRRGLAYGSSPAEALDFFPAPRPPAPLQVFVHGGYWQELGKDESAFPAPAFVAAGAAFATLDYGLAPACRLDDIVLMVRRALTWIDSHAGELGVVPGRVFVTGHSAGAHLAAMALMEGWAPASRHPTDLVAGMCLLSGVYDLEPVRLSYVNQALGLDAETAARNSPLLHLPDVLPPVIVARGGNETGEFARQHDEMVGALRARSASVTDIVVSERNHFDVPYDLGDPGTAVGAAVLAQMRLL